MDQALRIGCGGGFWGDTPEGPASLVRSGAIDVLVVDYLAEITMALLARLRMRSPDLGYVPDALTQLGALAPELARRAIKVVVNAGGVNPLACGHALRAVLAQQGASLKVAVVTGDDLMHRTAEFHAQGLRDMATGTPFPAAPWSANAYLGAAPIARALAAGADIVVTGRVADSALALGPLIHHFGWSLTDWDRLAMGSLAGHVIECGAQAVGGIATDWRDVPGWDDMAWPVVTCEADGGFIVSRAGGAGGRVTPATVAEQIVYEVGDPRAYVLPDVVCDFADVQVEQVGLDRVRVSGAKGWPASFACKASVTWPDGYKSLGMLMICGREAAAKARRTAAALIVRCERLAAERGLAPFAATSTEVLGAEDTYGPNAAPGARESREVVLKLAVRHAEKAGAELFSREFLSSASAMAQGTTGFAAGRPKVSPVIRLFSCLVDKASLRPVVHLDGQVIDCPFPPQEAAPEPRRRSPANASPPRLAAGEPLVTVPLAALAHARSGDKGDTVNIGLLARAPELVAVLAATVTTEAVAAWFAHLVEGPVERFDWPGLHGFNFLLHRALDGGGVASLRHDPQGKAYGQMLLDLPIAVPASWIAQGLIAEGLAVGAEA